MNKKIWITIGIIILVTLSWFFYSASKKQYCWPYCPEMTNEDREEIKESALDASIKDWKTYEDGKFGFKINYPTTIEQSSDENDYRSNRPNILVVFLNKNNSLPSLPDSIRIRLVPSADYQVYKDALINDVVYDGKGDHPSSFNDFREIKIGNNSFYYIVSGLFEGQLSLTYYFVSEDKRIFAFDISAQGVDWTNPNPDTIDNNSTHKILKSMLETLKFTK